MKIPHDFVKRLRSLHNALKRQSDASVNDELTDPVEQLLLSILAGNNSMQQAQRALEVVYLHIVDFNDLRVTPVPELAEMFDKEIGNPEEAAQAIVRTLKWIFCRFDTMNLKYLREQHNGALKSMFEEIPGCPDHARMAMLLLSFAVPVFPIDEAMLAYLVKNGALPEGVSLKEGEGFVQRHLKVGEIKQFYLNLKHASEHPRSAGRKTVRKKAENKKLK